MSIELEPAVSTCEAREPSYFENLINKIKWRWRQWRGRNDPSSGEKHAMREFLAAGYKPIAECEEDPEKWIQENVLELLRVFSKQGHSGFSAGICISMFEKLARFKPLVPLSGDESEWSPPYDTDGTQQNIRCSRVFRGADGRAYDIDGRVFREPNGVCYTGRDSRVYITFPYTPTTEYVDVSGEDEKEARE